MNKEGIDYALEALINMNTEKMRLVADNLTDKQYSIYLLGYLDAFLLVSFAFIAVGIQETLKKCEKDKSAEQALFLILSHLLSER
jgi:hypothetical protein